MVLGGAEEEVFAASRKDRLPSKGSAPSPSVGERCGVLRSHVSKALVFNNFGLIQEGSIPRLPALCIQVLLLYRLAAT